MQFIHKNPQLTPNEICLKFFQHVYKQNTKTLIAYKSEFEYTNKRNKWMEWEIWFGIYSGKENKLEK